MTQKKYSLANTIPTLRQFITDGILTTIRDRFVYPNKITFFLPFAGRPIAMRIQQVGSNAEEPRMLPVEALKEAASRFIDEILQLYKTEIISSVCAKDCKVYGFDPEGFSLDVEYVVHQFQEALDNPVFSVVDVQAKDKQLHLRFSCKGHLVGPLWKHFSASVGEIDLNGSMMFKGEIVDNGTAKLKSIHFLWDLNSLARILALPLAMSPKMARFVGRSLRQTS